MVWLSVLPCVAVCQPIFLEVIIAVVMLSHIFLIFSTCRYKPAYTGCILIFRFRIFQFATAADGGSKKPLFNRLMAENYLFAVVSH